MFREYLGELIKEGGSANAIAKMLGTSQGHLSDQKNGKKPITIDALDLVARLMNKSASEVLHSLSGHAQKLDKNRPGWDATPPSVLGKLRLATQDKRNEAAEKELQAREKSPSGRAAKKR